MAGLTINGKEYDLDPDKLSVGDACSVESFYQDTFGNWAKAAGAGSIRAIRALVLVLARRDDPSLTTADIDKLDLGSLMGLGKDAAAQAEPVAEDDPNNPIPFEVKSGAQDVAPADLFLTESHEPSTT